MKNILMLVIVVAMTLGCARGVSNPVAPSADPTLSGFAGDTLEGPYRLWGEWDFYIDESHEKIDVVPKRYSRFHLNALKFLEEYCTDCISIEGLENNGDGTIDLTVSITHPFPGMPQYTGFDVKGIIMFEGSRIFEFQTVVSPIYPEDFRASSRWLGDPELLNADGYTCRWSPWWDSGSSMPIFNYWPGKHSNGTPSANVNGYMNYYSNENRHMFESDAKVTRMYHISLPPGPLVVGYAIEACWVPPLVTPVINPAVDFPITANQPEPYYFNVVFNDGEPVTDWDCCNEELPYTVHEARCEMDLWYFPQPPDDYGTAFWVKLHSDQLFWSSEFHSLSGAPRPWDDHCDGLDNWWCIKGGHLLKYNDNGTYQCIAAVRITNSDVEPAYKYTSIDLFEIVIEK